MVTLHIKTGTSKKISKFKPWRRERGKVHYTHQLRKHACKQTTFIPGAYWWLTARYSTVAELMMQFGALLFVCTAVSHLATSGILQRALLLHIAQLKQNIVPSVHFIVHCEINRLVRCRCVARGGKVHFQVQALWRPAHIRRTLHHPSHTNSYNRNGIKQMMGLKCMTNIKTIGSKHDECRASTAQSRSARWWCS